MISGYELRINSNWSNYNKYIPGIYNFLNTICRVFPIWIEAVKLNKYRVQTSVVCPFLNKCTIKILNTYVEINFIPGNRIRKARFKDALIFQVNHKLVPKL